MEFVAAAELRVQVDPTNRRPTSYDGLLESPFTCTVRDGNPVIELRNAPSIVGRPGTVGHVAFRQWHQATAGDQGARILVFRVHTKGAPWRYPDETPAPKPASG